MKKRIFLIPMMCLSIGSLIGCGDSNVADLVIYNTIYTAENENGGLAEAFAVKDGKYIYVGNKNDVKQYIKEGKTEVIEGNGLVIPGATEGHAHYFDGVGLNTQLPGSYKSYEEVLDIVEAKYKEGAKQFVSFGWKTPSLAKRKEEGYNFAKEIEKRAPGIPVVLMDDSAHSAVCNETALRMAGIVKENPVIRGGAIYLDKNGDLSGYIGDQAVFYVIDKTISKPINKEQYREACTNGMNQLLQFGYTNALDAFTNMYDPTGLYEALKLMDDEHKLKMNVGECYNMKSFDASIYKSKVNEIKDIAKKYSSSHCNPTYIKIFVDGVVESGTGWIFDTYKYAQPGKEHGNIIWEKSELNAITTYANSLGLTIHSHSFGDAACDAAIDAYLTSNMINGGQFRNCLGHVRNIREQDVIRAANNSIPIAENLIWHTDFGPNDQEVKETILGNIGEKLYYEGYPMKSLLDKGAIVSSSSDAPAAMTIECNILNVIEVSTTGIPPEENMEPFAPNELITVDQALKCLTINGAWQLGLENERGSIKVGKYADFVVIDTNFLNYQGEELRNIHKAKILNTYFEGENVYTAK